MILNPLRQAQCDSCGVWDLGGKYEVGRAKSQELRAKAKAKSEEGS